MADKIALYLIAHIGHTGKWSEHVVWWKPESCGYTICTEIAGRYTEHEARDICDHCGTCVAIKADDVKPMTRSTPYFRLPSGYLKRLYDGDKHRPVPNSREAWKEIFAAALKTAHKPDKPTPIGAKARAIYLPSEN